MITYNNKHFFKDGKPWFPIMGEFEYSRCDSRFWRDGINKMKALGCDVVQSYVIWLHHEEIEGRYNFRGNNNLRKFVREIKDAGMLMCLRVGPWVHAEARNGGFPDWMYEKDFTPRTNDKGYMDLLEKYFTQLYEQCKGYMYSDGGPIFSIQVENEYQQSSWGAGRTREDAEKHVNDIIALLKKIGFDVPVYLATAWGNAVCGQALPCYGAYCEAPWENMITPLAPKAEYLMLSNPNSAPIGEYENTPLTTTSFTVSKQNKPYLTIELGTGVQPTKVRRPWSKARDNGAMTLCKLGQGVTNLGYYVFHGGMNPIGALSSLQEYRSLAMSRTRGWGFGSDVNEINYDFQGAVSQYGRVTDTGDELKLWMTFAREFEDVLTQSDTIIPDDNAKDASDFTSLRYTIRTCGNSGFVFVNNFTRLYDMPDKTFNDLTIGTGDNQVRFPAFTVKNKEYGAFPFNLKVGDMVVKYATATPYCTLNNKDLVMWYEGEAPQLCVSGMTDENIIMLDKASAKRAYKVSKNGKDYLIVTNGCVYERNGNTVADFTEDAVVKIYPAVPSLAGFTKQADEGGFAIFSKKLSGKSKVKYKTARKTKAYTDYEISVAYAPNCDNAYLDLDFSGDRVDLLIDGEKVNDRFYTGEPFNVGLNLHNFPTSLTLRVYPLEKDAFVYIEKEPKRNDKGIACSLNTATIKTVKTVEIKIK